MQGLSHKPCRTSYSQHPTPARPFLRPFGSAKRCATCQATKTSASKSISGGLQQSFSAAASFINTKLQNTAKEADFKFGISKRVKYAREDFARLWPYWKLRIEAFTDSQFGKVTLWGLFLYSIVSGLLFRALNLVFTLWLFGPLLLLPVLAVFGKRVKAAQQEAGQQAGRQAGQAAGFAGSRSRANASQANAGSPRGQKWQQRTQGRKQASQQEEASQQSWSPFSSDDGPVIDAEWVSLDDSGKRK